jgi:FlaA1/EpsC-like NDP-sugar epimerase
MLRIALKNPNTWLVLFVDALIFGVAYFLAYWLRFEDFDHPAYDFFRASVWYVVLVKMGVAVAYGLESGMWRYTGLNDFVRIVKATTVSFLVIIVGTIYSYYPDLVGSFSRSVFVLDAILATGLLTLFRLLIRWYYSREGSVAALVRDITPRGTTSRARTIDEGTPAVIYRADDRGELLLRSLASAAGGRRYRVFGFVDDNPALTGSSIHGFRVLGTPDGLEKIVNDFSLKEILVASVVNAAAMERLNEIARRFDLTIRVAPAYLDRDKREVSAASLRKIQIDDLLSREPVTIDTPEIARILAGKRVLVTGAGGSIGGELVRQIASYGPAQLILVDKSENYLHEQEMALAPPAGTDVAYYCVDITRREKMARIFADRRPQIVFHAAAHKHVPMMERNRDEAIRNNVGGMKVVGDLTVAHGAERFILISTDKAVDPANVMGATKRACELMMGAYAAGKPATRFMAVRFGNVLGSNGSVIPLFMAQIKRGGPLTVTHRDVTRYFMTIPEAVGLVLETGTMGGQGELFMLDMGAPVSILSVAEKMIRLAGFTPYTDIDIVFTGLRPGEKLEEVLVGAGEKSLPTAHGKVNKVIDHTPDPVDVARRVERLLTLCDTAPGEAADALMAWVATK